MPQPKPTLREARRFGQRRIVPAVQSRRIVEESGKESRVAFPACQWSSAGIGRALDYLVVQTLGEAVERDTNRQWRASADDGEGKKPDPMLPPDRQGNRSIVAIAPADIERRLLGSVEAETNARCTSC